jgi:hypothetical protein
MASSMPKGSEWSGLARRLTTLAEADAARVLESL